MKMILLATVMKTISLSQLLSSCMDASHHGCKVIKKFQEQGVVEGKLKEEGEIRSVLTQADLDAQARIIGSLRETWGNALKIIGEEDESEASPELDGMLLRKDILSEVAPTIEDDEIPLDELCLFVDPLDGTREFVEGRLQNVASLIGIARNNRTIAGVVGLPFPEGDLDVAIHYAIADQKGSAGSWPSGISDNSKASSNHDGITILTGDSSNPVLLNATNCAMSLADNPRHLIIGGTAAKLKQLQHTPDSIAILHFKTELWDTCAPESIINSIGGKVTDLFGSPLSHNPSRPFGNVFGVVASSGGKEVTELHDKLCSQMRSDTKAVKTIFGKWMGSTEATEPQGVDVVRNLDGIPLGLDEIEKFILSEEKRGKTKLKGYSVPESGAWRGLMSNGGRIILDWEQGDNHDLPSSVFYKVCF